MVSKKQIRIICQPFTNPTVHFEELSGFLNLGNRLRLDGNTARKLRTLIKLKELMHKHKLFDLKKP